MALVYKLHTSSTHGQRQCIDHQQATMAIRLLACAFTVHYHSHKKATHLAGTCSLTSHTPALQLARPASTSHTHRHSLQYITLYTVLVYTGLHYFTLAAGCTAATLAALVCTGCTGLHWLQAALLYTGCRLHWSTLAAGCTALHWLLQLYMPQLRSPQES